MYGLLEFEYLNAHDDSLNLDNYCVALTGACLRPDYLKEQLYLGVASDVHPYTAEKLIKVEEAAVELNRL